MWLGLGHLHTVLGWRPADGKRCLGLRGCVLCVIQGLCKMNFMCLWTVLVCKVFEIDTYVHYSQPEHEDFDAARER